MYLKYYFLIALLLIYFNISCNTIKGYIITNNNDTLKGTFPQLQFMSYSVSGFFIRKFDDTDMVAVHTVERIKANIKMNSIKSINIINKYKKDTSTYVYINNYCWQLLATKGNFSIYKRNYSTKTGYSQAGYIASSSQPYYIDTYEYDEDIYIFLNLTPKVQIYKGAQWAFFLLKKPLLQFINTRYKLSLVNQDFKEEKAMYDFILEQEVKLEQQEK